MFGFRRQVVTTDVPVKPVDAYVAPQPVVDGAPVVQTVPVVTTTPVPAETAYVNTHWDDHRLAISRRIQDIFGFIFSLAAILIIARFVLLALGASTDGQFAQYVLAWSQPLIAPFLGLFGNPSVPHFQVFEIADIIALLVFGIVTSLVCYLVGLLLNPTMPSRRVIVRP